MLAEVATPLRFDGRDLTDFGRDYEDVVAYELYVCTCCSAQRDVRYPFCCEFAQAAQYESDRRA